MKKILITILIITTIGLVGCNRKNEIETGLTEPINTFDQLDELEQVDTLKLALEQDKDLNIKTANVMNIAWSDMAIDLETSDLHSDDEEYLNHYKYEATADVTLNNDMMYYIKIWITPTGDYSTDLLIQEKQIEVKELLEDKLGLLNSDIEYASTSYSLQYKPVKSNDLKKILEDGECDTTLTIIVNIEDKEKVWEIIEENSENLNFTSGEIRVYYNEDKNISSLYNIDLSNMEINYDTYLFVKGLNN